MAKKTEDVNKDNTPTKEDVEAFLSAHDEAQEALDAQHMEYMRERQKLYKVRDNCVKEHSKKLGVKQKSLKHIIKEHKLRDDLENIDDDVEDTVVDQAEMLRQALGEYGDTPLGQAAQAAAE